MKPKTIRLAMLLIIWIVIICSFSLSFAGVRSLAISSGYGPVLASLMPICLDGMLMAGALTVLDAEAKDLSKKFGWTITIVGVFASVMANVATAAPLGLTAMIVHAAPPIVLALTLEAWLATQRSGVRRQLEAEAIEAEELATAEALEAKRIAEAEALAQREAERQERAELMAKRKTPVSAKQVQDLRATGLTWKQTSAALGVSEHVAQKALKNQSPVEDPSWAREEKAAAA